MVDCDSNTAVRMTGVGRQVANKNKTGNFQPKCFNLIVDKNEKIKKEGKNKGTKKKGGGGNSTMTRS